MTRPAPRRRAERPRSRRARLRTSLPPRHATAPVEAGDDQLIEVRELPLEPKPSSADPSPEATSEPAGVDPSPKLRLRSAPRLPRQVRMSAWWVLLALAALCLAAGAFELGPRVLGSIGAVAVLTLDVWALAARTGGRPVIFSALALVCGTVVVALGRDDLRTGAAVITAAVAAVLAVMATVPARRFLVAARECLLATATAALGTLAAVGFEPVTEFSRFQYAVTGIALIVTFILVYRLGAGLHGLGRRGLLVVAIGGLVLAVMLLYAEILRRYGSSGLLEGVNDVLEWCRNHLYGYPRPIIALLGVPALVWGTHMRARRRQGWWVCAFGVAMTAPVACSLVNPDVAVGEALATTAYSLLVGLVIGLVSIYVDVLLTGGAPVQLDPSKAGAAARRVGRRAARDDDESAVRPEPRRTQALL